MPRSISIHWLALPVTAVILVMSCRGHIQTQEQPEATVERLVSLPHGLQRMGPEERATVDRVLAEPGPYIEALREAFPAARIRELGPDVSGEDMHRFERAVQLLGRIATPESQELLAEWYDVLTALAAEREGAPTPLLLKRFLLDALPDTATQTVLENVAGDLTQVDDATFYSIAKFLQRAGRGNPAVQKRLQAALDDPEVPEARRRELARLERQLRGEEAEIDR